MTAPSCPVHLGAMEPCETCEAMAEAAGRQWAVAQTIARLASERRLTDLPKVCGCPSTVVPCPHEGDQLAAWRAQRAERLALSDAERADRALMAHLAGGVA